jgi:uncharacterized protein with FMN-binding domain
MKKLFVGLFVLATFVIYSLHQRQEASSAVVTPKTSSQTTATSSSSNSGTAPATNVATSYKDGQYTGSVEDAFYGSVQVKATVSGGKITDVEFLQYPNDRQNSISINEQAMPLLKQEAVQAQTAQVDTISGATDTSQAFIQSLSTALKEAQS